MSLSKLRYIFCLCIIVFALFANANRGSLEPMYSHQHGSANQGPLGAIPLAYSLYYYHIFPVYLQPIADYTASTRAKGDWAFPLYDSPYHGGKAKEIFENCKKENIHVMPYYDDLGSVFLIYIASLFHGQFYPTGVLGLHMVIYLSILLFLFHSFYRQKMSLIGLLVCVFLASNTIIVSHFCYNTFTGWGYPLLGALLTFAILLPIVLNRPLSEKELWFRITCAGIVFFIFMTIRSSMVFISLSVLFFVLIYGKLSKYKRLARVGVTLLVLVVPYLGYSNLVTYLRHYYHSKFQLSDPTNNYSGAHHLIWHGIYCGLGDFGQDKGFEWRDKVAEDYAESIKPGVCEYDDGVLGLSDAEYEVILRNKILTTICENPLWYLKILSLRIKRIFWDHEHIVGAFFYYWNVKNYSWTVWVYRISLIAFLLLSVLFKKYKELRIYLFFIPTIFTGLFITTAIWPRYCLGVIVLYFLPFVFVVSFLVRVVIDRVTKPRILCGLQKTISIV